METAMPASRGRLLTRRAVATGSLLGVGVLAATAAAPAAQATPTSGDNDQIQQDEDSGTAATPLQDPPPVEVGDGVELGGDFGTGKEFRVALDPSGAYPGDLDRSGVTFSLRDGDGTTYPCTTDAEGVCTFETPEGAEMASMANWMSGGAIPLPENARPVPDGAYTVVRAGTVAGLLPVDGTVGDLGTVSLGSGIGTTDGAIPDVSVFRRSVVATVVDALSSAAVPGVTYDLTGPDYRHAPASPATTRDAGTTTTGTDGTATWADNWFLPGTWTFTPQTTPAGFLSDSPWTTTIPAAPGQTDHSWTAQHGLLAGTPDSTSVGSAGTTTAAPPSSSPAPVAAPASASPPRPRPVAPVLPAPATAGSAADTGSDDSSGAAVATEAAPTSDAAPATPSPISEPRLRTVSRTFPESGLIGIGIFFVLVVFFAVVLVRRRARRG
jgi:hypothetical protein